MWEMSSLWLFLVAFTTSTTGYAVSPVAVVALAVAVPIVKGALFLAARVMSSAFIWKINLLRDLSLVALANPVQSGEGGFAGDACLLETTVASLVHFSQVPGHYQTAAALSQS